MTPIWWSHAINKLKEHINLYYLGILVLKSICWYQIKLIKFKTKLFVKILNLSFL